MQPLLDLLTGGSDEVSLDRAALEVARIEHPNLDIAPFIAILDFYAAELSERLAGRAGGSGYVEAANQYLFAELGFKGNSANYYDPGNSCLNDVLTARTGIPITLAVVYLEVGRRLAQPVYGIGLPGHFLVQYRSAGFAAFIDVFHQGRLLTEEECFDLARQSTGAPLRRSAHAGARRQSRDRDSYASKFAGRVYAARRLWQGFTDAEPVGGGESAAGRRIQAARHGAPANGQSGRRAQRSGSLPAFGTRGRRPGGNREA